MKRIILFFAIMAATATAAATEPPPALTPQQIAENRAAWIVSQPRGYYWHPRFDIGGNGGPFWLWSHARFEGLGFGRPGSPVTWSCRPRRRGMRLVGDAYATGPRMSVRVRLWR